MVDAMYWQEELLALNPWARELWGQRWELVESKQWNLFSVDQSGNNATSHWLADFQTARRKASRKRLEAGKVTWNAWAERTADLIAAMANAGFWDIGRLGTNTSSNRAPQDTPRFLTADVLLLVRADFYEAVIEARADFSGMWFPGGADFRGAQIGAGTRFDQAIFGDRTGFDDARIGAGTTFGQVAFGRWVRFTFATLERGVDFTDAVFGFACSFSGAQIGDDVSFRNVRFGESFAFEGVSTGPRTHFDGARFADRARFGGAVFDTDVSFNRATFDGRVSFCSASGKRPSFDGTEFACPKPLLGAQFLQ